jgi:hypothetical protein
MSQTPKNPGPIDPKTAGKPDEIAATDNKPASKVIKSTNHSSYLSTREAPEDMPDLASRKKKTGRPTKYKPIYCQAIIKFFDREHTYEAQVTHTNRKGESWTSYQTRANPVPLMIDFAEYLGVFVSTLWRWTKEHSDFCKASSHAQELQLAHLATITGLGLYNSNWSVFMAKNISDWRDKKDIEHSGEVGLSGLIEGLAGKAAEARQDRSRITGLN